MLKNLFCILVFDICINAIVFLPFSNRDELSDYFVTLPAILLLNLYICYIFIRQKKKLGYYFAANLIIEAVLFIAIQTSICKYMTATFSTVFHFNDSNHTIRIKIYNRSDHFNIELNEDTTLCVGNYDKIGDTYNLYISKWLANADQIIEVSNNYPHNTLFIKNDSLYNWSENPTDLTKEESK